MAKTTDIQLNVSLEHLGEEVLALPHLDQYFGVWAIREDVFTAAVERVNKLDLAAHIQANAAKVRGARGNRYEMVNDIAVIRITGALTKYGGSLSTGVLEYRQRVRDAHRDPDVGGVVLLIDSPGGSVSGIKDLADDVAALAAAKPVLAYCEDQACSAAIPIAVQGNKVYANKTAVVGSIGVFAVLTDSSKAAEDLGFKVHVVRAGALKGAGTPGTEITEEQLAETQKVVDAINEEFLGVIAKGRNLSATKAAELNDGRVWVGQEAVSVGLVDSIKTLDETIAEMRQLIDGKSGSRKAQRTESKMSEETKSTEAPAAATIGELEAACKGAAAEFLCAQLKKGATVAQAQEAFIAAQAGRITALTEQVAQAEAKAKKPGVEALDDKVSAAGEESADAVAEFNSKVSELVATGKTKAQATSQVARKYPELRKAMVAAANVR